MTNGNNFPQLVLDQQISPTARQTSAPPVLSSYISNPARIVDESDHLKLHADIPPKHIMSHLLDVYYSRVHLVFPFLPERQVLNLLALAASSPAHLDPTPRTNGVQTVERNSALLLAICGYTGQLSPFASASSSSGAMNLGASQTRLQLTCGASSHECQL